MSNGTAIKKGVFLATVKANKQIGQRFYRLRLEFSGVGAEAFAGVKPGQFAQLDLSRTALPAAKDIPDELANTARRNILLRRPFSFANIATEENKTLADILYCVVGPASLRMTTLSAGDSVSIIGPLGILVPEGKKKALLVAGGMGAGPLQHLAKVLTADYPDIKVMAFAGAKSAKDLPFTARLDEIAQQLGFSLQEFAQYGIESLVATDDGSAGYHGLVSDCLTKWLDQATLVSKDTIVYSCGPEAMLAKVADITRKNKIDCQVSMERMMACGIGVCQSCAVEYKADRPGKTVYKLCCKDGPVFDSRQVVFSA
ncbi:MAG: dihydroorotate dehydrogenase electron transfer subunit, partial [Planctomycetota bacterium]|jgi:dihydroorotate dehydrogenase electron transfer subunit